MEKEELLEALQAVQEENRDLTALWADEVAHRSRLEAVNEDHTLKRFELMSKCELAGRDLVAALAAIARVRALCEEPGPWTSSDVLRALEGPGEPEVERVIPLDQIRPSCHECGQTLPLED